MNFLLILQPQNLQPKNLPNTKRILIEIPLMYNTVPATNLNYQKPLTQSPGIGENNFFKSVNDTRENDFRGETLKSRSRFEKWKSKIKGSTRSSIFLPEPSEVTKPLTPHELLDFILSTPVDSKNSDTVTTVSVSPVSVSRWSDKIKDISMFLHRNSDMDFDKDFEARLANGIVKLRKSYTENDDIIYVKQQPKKKLRFLRKRF